ncbi:unnamed protein product [Penicillium salamii]|uniref:NmrA-like domain-containing protein n=1 Tax=Penicillium salamii TaxID=1612424 RepID=A0A9W4JME8_9EURO|nr:unnamed protein product [Penicillium salamii]CAG8334286.1 unnamed protein product [Penicillium salamii]CAG8340495.1 unnamed protein product [Penicillium salamii]CAG8382099.1 unnamed protein product [Penicillium salamii]CAG8388085.1 unnamed protein product [Penicillium salamii]
MTDYFERLGISFSFEFTLPPKFCDLPLSIISSMAMRITIFGATGNQGGSAARSLLQNPTFQVRGISRDPNSDASKKLAEQGAEVVQANGFDFAQMVAAFQDSWGAFVNINSDDEVFQNNDGPIEFDMGKIIVDAAIKAGVQCFVFSSGPPCTEMTNGEVQMKAMDMKYKVEQYARRSEAFQTFIPIGAGWFLENFLSKEVAPVFGGFPHFVDSEGYFTFRVPNWGGDGYVPWLSISDDFGDIVHGIYLDPVRWNGKFVHGISDIRTFENIMMDFNHATGSMARFDPILPDWKFFDTHGIHQLEDVKLMFGLAQITGGRSFEEYAEIETAFMLKQATAEALGWPQKKHYLVTTTEWFDARFGSAGFSNTPKVSG